ncbi:MAG: hypothetical protein LBM13_01300, partial [Candidatus Ancillula sp.]|nr:hypothetical protein [Candidatus Ancillula sp.]
MNLKVINSSIKKVIVSLAIVAMSLTLVIYSNGDFLSNGFTKANAEDKSELINKLLNEYKEKVQNGEADNQAEAKDTKPEKIQKLASKPKVQKSIVKLVGENDDTLKSGVPDGNYTIKNGIFNDYSVAYLGDAPDGSYNYNGSQHVGDEINIYAYYEGELNGQDYKGLVYVGRTPIRVKEMFNGRDAIVTDLMVGWTSHLTTGLSESGNPLSITIGNIIQRKGEDKLIPGTEWWNASTGYDKTYDVVQDDKTSNMVWKYDGIGHKAGDPVQEGDIINVYSRDSAIRDLPSVGRSSMYMGRQRAYAINSGEAFNELRILPNGDMRCGWLQQEKDGLNNGGISTNSNRQTLFSETDIPLHFMPLAMGNIIKSTDGSGAKDLEDARKVMSMSYKAELVLADYYKTVDSKDIRIISQQTQRLIDSIKPLADFFFDLNTKIINSGLSMHFMSNPQVGKDVVTFFGALYPMAHIAASREVDCDIVTAYKRALDKISLMFDLGKSSSSYVDKLRYAILNSYANFSQADSPTANFYGHFDAIGIGLSYRNSADGDIEKDGGKIVYGNNIKYFIDQVSGYIKNHSKLSDQDMNDL